MQQMYSLVITRTIYACIKNFGFLLGDANVEDLVLKLVYETLWCNKVAVVRFLLIIRITDFRETIRLCEIWKESKQLN